MEKTRKEMFLEIMEAVKGNDEMVEFLSHQIEMIDRKASSPRKPSKVQLENDIYKAEILKGLENIDMPMTINGLMGLIPAIAGLTNQRITHMLTDLRKEGLVKRTYIKRVAYFELGSEDMDG